MCVAIVRNRFLTYIKRHTQIHIYKYLNTYLHTYIHSYTHIQPISLSAISPYNKQLPSVHIPQFLLKTFQMQYMYRAPSQWPCGRRCRLMLFDCWDCVLKCSRWHLCYVLSLFYLVQIPPCATGGSLV